MSSTPPSEAIDRFIAAMKEFRRGRARKQDESKIVDLTGWEPRPTISDVFETNRDPNVAFREAAICLLETAVIDWQVGGDECRIAMYRGLSKHSVFDKLEVLKSAPRKTKKCKTLLTELNAVLHNAQPFRWPYKREEQGYGYYNRNGAARGNLRELERLFMMDLYQREIQLPCLSCWTLIDQPEMVLCPACLQHEEDEGEGVVETIQQWLDTSAQKWGGKHLVAFLEEPPQELIDYSD